MGVLEAAREVVRSLGELDLTEVTPTLLAVLSEIESWASTRKLLLAQKIECPSGEPNMATFLARGARVPLGRVQGELRRAGVIASVPEIEADVFDGGLSLDQAHLIATAVRADRSCLDQLRRIAQDGGIGELSAEVRRIKRRALSEKHQRDRIDALHRNRHCSITIGGDGAVRVTALLDPVEGAKLKASLEAEARRLAQKGSFKEAFTTYLADALCGRAPGAGIQALLIVSAEALKRGAVAAGEYCEIEGIGEISVDHAKSLLDEAVWTAIVAQGQNIYSVATRSRNYPVKIVDALKFRDRMCCVPGCEVTWGLQIHHRKRAWAKGGLTAFDNLCRLCAFHHRLTEEGFAIEGEPGAWVWIEPVTTEASRAASGPCRSGPEEVRQRIPSRAGP